MLSVLIPIYNYNTVALVQQLHQQATETGITFEILLLDDQSDEKYKRENSVLRNLPYTTLFELPSKAGRAAARNYLAEQAKYDYLLFLDCDAEPVDNKYIERYLPYCKKNTIVCGGTAYKKQEPDRNSYLRWTYGVRCEAKTASRRNRKPNSGLTIFNFLMDRRLFLSIRFNELLYNYGHEDTLFGLELKKNHYTIIHIDNPLYHNGIDINDVYMEKTRYGIENLQILLKRYPDKEELNKGIRLLRHYAFLEKTHTTALFSLFFRLFKPAIITNLYGKHPSMTLFNLYKLGYLCGLKKSKNE